MRFAWVLLLFVSSSVYSEWIFFQNHLHSTSEHTFNRFPEYTSYQKSYSSKGIQELIQLAKERGIHSLAITDHNTISHWFDPIFVNERQVLLVPAMEFSHMFGGHATLLGFSARDEKEAIMPSHPRGTADHYDYKKLIQAVHDREGLVVINHPKSTYFPHRWPANSYGADGIELNFSYFMKPGQVIEWWEELLQEGDKIFLLGGSDYHVGSFRNKFYGDPFDSTNLIWVEERSSEAILKTLSQGRIQVMRSPYSPKVFLTAKTEEYLGEKEFQIGDTISLVSAPQTALQRVFLQVEVVGGKGTKMKVYNKKEGIQSLNIDTNYFFKVIEYIPRFEKDYIRCELFKNDELETVVNPLYIRVQ